MLKYDEEEGGRRRKIIQLRALQRSLSFSILRISYFAQNLLSFAIRMHIIILHISMNNIEYIYTSIYLCVVCSCANTQD